MASSSAIQLPHVINDVLSRTAITTNNDTTKSHQESSGQRVTSFESLPQELIDKIAQYALVYTEPITIQCDRRHKLVAKAQHWSGPGHPLGLAMVSKRLYRASIRLFYEQNRFIVRLKHDNCPLAHLFSASNFKFVKSITLSLGDPWGVNFHALLNLTNLRRLKVFISKYDNYSNWHNPRSGMLEVCRTLRSLNHIEIVAQSPIFTGLRDYSFERQNWSYVEHLVDKMRRVVERRNLEVCVHLREIFLYDRHAEGQFYLSRPLKKKMRMYAAPYVYIFVSEDTLEGRTGSFAQWQRERRRLLAATASARPT